MITVKYLKEMLEQHEDTDVMIVAENEGNAFSPLSSLEECIYVPESTWAGWVHLRELKPEDLEAGFDDEDVYSGPDGQKALILRPVH